MLNIVSLKGDGGGGDGQANISFFKEWASDFDMFIQFINRLLSLIYRDILYMKHFLYVSLTLNQWHGYTDKGIVEKYIKRGLSPTQSFEELYCLLSISFFYP